MTTKIFDLRITQADEPDSDQQIVGNSTSIYPHISNQLANLLESVSMDDEIEINFTEVSTLKNYKIKSVN